MDREEINRERRRDEEERKFRGHGAYKWAERDLLVCQSCRSHPSPGEKWEKGETLTLHYLCLVVLVQADAASHCVFIMRNCYEAEKEETQQGGQST